MTRYEQGFMSKCAEYGVPEQVAGQMLKSAVTKHVTFANQPETGDRLKITSAPDGVTTNGPSGLPVMSGEVIGEGRPIDLDPVTALTQRTGGRGVVDFSADSIRKLIDQTGDKPVLSSLGTNVVDNAISSLYPGNFKAKKEDVGIPRRSQWNPEPYSAEDGYLRTRWLPGILFGRNYLRPKPDYDATAAALNRRLKFITK